MNERLRHDVAVAVTRQLMDMIEALLSPAEREIARERIYAVVASGLEAYELHRPFLEPSKL